jgi:Kef-type K+ transport system membrane component KefB
MDLRTMKRSSVLQAGLIAAALILIGAGVVLSRAIVAPMDELGWLAFGLSIVVTAALLGGHLATRAGQPAVLGELVVGMALGNMPGLARLHFIAADPFLDILSRVGMLLLLFEVGLDLSVRDLFSVGASALLVAVIGTLASLAAGTGTASLLMPDGPLVVKVFLGAAITATSVGITARVLRDLGKSRSGEAKVILGAAVVDDVLALVVLGAMTSWAGAGQGSEAARAAPILALVTKTVGFLTLALLVGLKLTPAWFRRAAAIQTKGALLAVGLCFCFFLSWAASAMGLAALVGAFAAGLVLEDTHSELFVRRGERSLGELLQPMTSFLVPVFFVLVGFRTHLGVLLNPAFAALSIGLTIAAVAGKLACAGGVVAGSVRRLAVAIGMIPRGEVTLVFAALGSALRIGPLPLLDDRGYTALVTVVILTTLVTPPALKWTFARRADAHGITRPAA